MHSHTGDPLLPKKRQVQALLRERASVSMETTSSVVSSALQGASADSLQRLPKRTALDDNCRAKRRATNPVQANPQSLNFVMPAEFVDMVLYDSGPQDPNRFIILGKIELMEVLENADVWLGDGTFDVCPSVFYQLYTIHTKVGNSFPPCVYFLLPNKTQEIYSRALEQLRVLIPNASPDTVLVDFEAAAINAFRQAFPTAELKGCYFHHGQSLNRKVGELGLKLDYESNPDFNMAVKSLQALAFVPEENVLEIFLELAESFPDLERVEELVAYFEVTYVRGRERGGGRGQAQPRYSQAFWNHFNSTLNNVPRTTNAVEGYHNALNSLFLAKNPSVWKLMTGLQKDMTLQLKTLADDRVANNPPVRQKYVILNQRLATKVTTFANTANKLEYLRSIAHINSTV